MPFLPPNQQRQSTGRKRCNLLKTAANYCLVSSAYRSHRSRALIRPHAGMFGGRTDVSVDAQPSISQLPPLAHSIISTMYGGVGRTVVVVVDGDGSRVIHCQDTSDHQRCHNNGRSHLHLRCTTQQHLYVLDLLAVGPTFTRPASRAAAAAIDRYLPPATDLSSKPAGRRCCCRSTGQTDGQTRHTFSLKRTNRCLLCLRLRAA